MIGCENIKLKTQGERHEGKSKDSTEIKYEDLNMPHLEFFIHVS
jgi:hypothetical protein